MNKYFKSVLLTIVLFFVFFINVNDVKAISFVKIGRIKYNSSFTLKEYESGETRRCSSSNCTFLKIDQDGNLAYCSQHKLNSPNSKTNYSKSVAFSKSKSCTYGKNHTNLDCSSMVGYIINAANSKAAEEVQNDKTEKKVQGYIYAQTAIQTYLYNYSGVSSWKKGNEGVANAKNNSKIKDILNKAYQAYAKGYAASSSSSDDIDFKMKLSIGGNLLSSAASKDGQGNSLYSMNLNPDDGYYVSYLMTFTGLSTATNVKNIKYTVTSNDPDNVEFCKEGKNVCEPSIDISTTSPNNQFYVRTKRSNKSVTMTILAEGKKLVNSSTVTYDSVRYNASNKQDMIILEKNSENDKNYKNDSDSLSIRFYPVAVDNGSCNTYYPNSSTASDTKITGKICKKDDSTSLDAYTAKYDSCTENNTISIDYYLKGDSTPRTAKVGIIIDQKGDFLYGALLPATKPLYAGGGFGLGYTYYLNQVAWRYKYMKHSSRQMYIYYGNKQYINDNTIICSDKSGSSCGRAYDVIYNLLKEKVKSNTVVKDLTNDLAEHTFLSYSSDVVSTKFEDVTVNVVSNYNEVVNASWPDGQYKKILYTISLNNAYKNIATNKIDYSGSNRSNDGKYVDYGKMYYTSLKFQGKTWPFNVSTKSLSSINGINWSLEAECSVELEDDNRIYGPVIKDGYLSIKARYRSIDVNNPFPKAGSDIKKYPENWQGWYSESDNKQRLVNSYNDSRLVYKISIPDNEVSDVASYNNNNYTSWEGMNSSGVSSFVGKYFEKIASKESYCPLGEFNSECDIYR